MPMPTNSHSSQTPLRLSDKASPMQLPLPESLEERYHLVCERIARAAERSRRRASDVILVAVTKFADAEQIRTLVRLGHKDFGENRVQVFQQHAAIVDEALSRQRMMPNAGKRSTMGDSLFAPTVELKPGTPGASGVRWHMIGHLQRNKAKKIIDAVRLVHSVDSLRIAEELQSLALRMDTIVEVLLQVNCSGEGQKFGCPIPAAIPLAEQIGTMLNLRLRGVMTMAAETQTPEDARPTFVRCREIFEEIRALRVSDAPCNLLSMGMSNDFEVAIEEGANIVRVGSAIFGTNAAPAHEQPSDNEDEAT